VPRATRLVSPGCVRGGSIRRSRSIARVIIVRPPPLPSPPSQGVARGGQTFGAIGGTAQLASAELRAGNTVRDCYDALITGGASRVTIDAR
jgi:hypothetical protein